MPSEPKHELMLESQGSFEPVGGSTAKYARDAAAALLEGAAPDARRNGDVDGEQSESAPDGAVGNHQPFVPAREQKTIISKRPAQSSSVTPLGAPPLQEIGNSLVGQMLDHFELVEFVGGGGMGAVFRAIDTHLGRDVAVKVLSRDQNDEETIRRFKNEAQSAARLDHPNIARVYFVGEALNWNYIVFEFIEGANIRDLIAQRGEPLPLEEAISYVLQIAQALEHASQRDVVHRDIKPSNILITPQRVAKLVDMGLARLHQVESPDNDLTASGVTLGTFDYISPEQARDPRSADVRSDLYSLGCTFYYMLTGRPPFLEGTVLQKLLSHTSDEPPDVRLYRPDLPEDVTDVLSKLLAKNPRDRYQRPGALIAELVVLAELYGWTEIGRVGAVWAPAPETALTRLERWLPIALPCLLLIVVAVFLGAPWRQSEDDSIEPPSPRLLAEDPSAKAERAGSNAATSSQAGVEPDRKAQPSAEDIDSSKQENDDAAARPRRSDPPSDVNTGDGNKTRPANPTDTAVERTNENPKVVSTADPVPIVNPATVFGPGDKASPPSFASAPVRESSALTPVASDTAKLEAQAPAAATKIGEPSPSSIADKTASGDKTASADRSSTAEARVRKTAPDAKTRRLVVGGPDLTPDAVPGDSVFGEDAFVVPSLAAACRYAAELPGVEAIELWFDGPRQEPPLSIGAKRLTLRAGAGYRPVVVIRPEAGAAADGGLVRLSGGDFSFAGIDWWCELPASGYGPWSLFQLDRVVSAELTDCTVTLVNADERGRDRHSAAAFFEIRPPPLRDPRASEMSGAMPDGAQSGDTMAIAGMPTTSPAANAAAADSTADSTTGAQPSAAAESSTMGGMATSGMAKEGDAYGPSAIRLTRCLVRGEATLVLAERAQPFSLQWSQGLYVSNRRLLEIGAVSRQPDWGAPIEVDLSQVTVFAAAGLCLYRVSGDAAYALPLNVDSRYCIFLADPTAPLVEHRLPQKDGFEPTLYVTGIDNFYPYPTEKGSQVYWRTGEGPSIEDRAIERRDPKWCSDMNPQRSVLWASPPDPSKPIHARDASDYLLSRNNTNRAVKTGGAGGWAGFSPDLLPAAPEPPVQP